MNSRAVTKVSSYTSSNSVSYSHQWWQWYGQYLPHAWVNCLSFFNLATCWNTWVFHWVMSILPLQYPDRYAYKAMVPASVATLSRASNLTSRVREYFTEYSQAVTLIPGQVLRATPHDFTCLWVHCIEHVKAVTYPGNAMVSHFNMSEWIALSMFKLSHMMWVTPKQCIGVTTVTCLSA